MADVQHGHGAVGLVYRVDNPIAMPLAPVEQVAEVTAFRDGRSSGRMLVKAQHRPFKPVEPCAGPRAVLGVDGQVEAA